MTVLVGDFRHSTGEHCASTALCNLLDHHKEQSERSDCDPELFRRAGRMTADLAVAEEAFFVDALQLVESA